MAGAGQKKRDQQEFQHFCEPTRTKNLQNPEFLVLISHSCHGATLGITQEICPTEAPHPVGIFIFYSPRQHLERCFL